MASNESSTFLAWVRVQDQIWLQSHLLEPLSQSFNQAFSNVLHLRPGYFMENFLEHKHPFFTLICQFYVARQIDAKAKNIKVLYNKCTEVCT